jgi:hypothetical protein
VPESNRIILGLFGGDAVRYAHDMLGERPLAAREKEFLDTYSYYAR